jgi:hydroxyacylglutathione hydrolase
MRNSIDSIAFLEFLYREFALLSFLPNLSPEFPLVWHRVARDIYSIETGPSGCEHHIQTYVIVDPERRVAIIDPGPRSSAEKLLNNLVELGFTARDVELILLTHIHLDHGGGAASLARMLGGKTPIMVHPIGHKHVVDPSRLWQSSRELLGEVGDIYGRPENASDLDVRELQDSSAVSLGRIGLRIIYTPGHASHHLSIYAEDLGALFVGDAAGIYIVGEDLLYPTTPPPFRYQHYLSSLEKLLSLKPDIVAFSHEGARIGYSILERAKKQIIEWFELVSRGNEALDDIVRVEPQLRRYLEAMKSEVCRKIVSRLLDLSLKGLREEATRIQTQETARG